MSVTPPTARRHLRVRLLAPLALVCGAGTVACGGPPNTLTGSVTQVRDLGFSRVVINTSATSVVIQYIKPPPGNEITARLSIAASADPNIALGKPAFVGGTSTFTDAVKLSRVSAPNADGTPSSDVFPNVLSGSVTFDQVSLTAGQMVSGSFGLLLGGIPATGTQAAIPAGYTLNGTFHQAAASP